MIIATLFEDALAYFIGDDLFFGLDVDEPVFNEIL